MTGPSVIVVVCCGPTDDEILDSDAPWDSQLDMLHPTVRVRETGEKILEWLGVCSYAPPSAAYSCPLAVCRDTAQGIVSEFRIMGQNEAFVCMEDGLVPHMSREWFDSWAVEPSQKPLALQPVQATLFSEPWKKSKNSMAIILPSPTIRTSVLCERTQGQLPSRCRHADSRLSHHSVLAIPDRYRLCY